MKGGLIAFLLIYLSSIAIVPAYAENEVEVHSNNDTSTGHVTEVHVINNLKSETIVKEVKTEVITIVVTATPMPSPTAKPFIPYKAVKAVYSTPTPTFTPTATPSATMTPTPTKKPPLKAVENNHNLFQTIITQNQHPMTATPVKSVCSEVIAPSLRR